MGSDTPERLEPGRLPTALPAPLPARSAAPLGGVLACPHCGLELRLSPSGAACPTGHSFDRGRGGYLNLLVGGRLSAGTTPGDTPDALAARRRFLHAGHYSPIAGALAQAVGAPDGPVLDVGCGEGYYLAQLPLPDRYGLDVAKSAVQMAARLLPDAQFVVGSAYRLPVLAGSVAVVTSVFAPHPFEEFERVLRPGGRWVTVTPGPDHLREMRPVLSGESERKANERMQRRALAPAEAAGAHRLTFQLQLSAESLGDLFFMTPIRWQAGATGGTATAGRTVTVDVWVSSSQR
ncbi:MAG: methyltransferase domain-containing protein [Ilumatobacteraceae bacterium]